MKTSHLLIAMAAGALGGILLYRTLNTVRPFADIDTAIIAI